MKYKYLFGPVASRRLGLSLGIDLIPHKTCSFDCIYCECGATTCLSSERKEYIPTKLIQDELDHYFKKDYKKNQPDYFTFSGSGEPTMASNIGKVIDIIKTYKKDAKIVVLTNSSLLYNKTVRDEIKSASIISPSLDSVLEESFQIINRPESKIQLSQIIQGLIDLRTEFKGLIWLEVFIIPEINTSEKELKRFKEVIQKIKPDKVQLNSLDRPGVKKEIPKASKKLLSEIADYWNLPNVEIIPNYTYDQNKIKKIESDLINTLIQTIKRRPSTLNDLSVLTGKSQNEISDIIQLLSQDNNIKISILERGTFYSIM